MSVFPFPAFSHSPSHLPAGLSGMLPVPELEYKGRWNLICPDGLKIPSFVV